jgi:hypothetical protein
VAFVQEYKECGELINRRKRDTSDLLDDILLQEESRY